MTLEMHITGTTAAGRRSTVGLASLLVTVATLAVLVIPGAGEMLAMHRAAVMRGAWWQIVTGHLTHFGAGHWVWDAVAFLVLGLVAERQSVRAWAVTVVGSAVVIGVAVLAWAPGVNEYRGLSGIDAALFGVVAVELWRGAAGCGRALVAIMVAAFLGKIVLELATGRTVFVQDLGPGVGPVALAHAVGFAWGAAVGYGWVEDE